MQKSLIEQLYIDRGYDDLILEEAIQLIDQLESHCSQQYEDLDTITIPTLQTFIDDLIDQGKNTSENLLALARYYAVIDNQEIYVYFKSLFGSVGVVQNICHRLQTYGSTSHKDFTHEPPVLGQSLQSMAAYTANFIQALESVEDWPRLNKVLAGNNHDLPREVMLKEKAYYEQSASLDHYLKERHERKVAELTEHYNNHQVWFEQIITPEVIDYVANNQEILSAVRHDNCLYVTKIPYDTKKFLEAKEPHEKRYHACHCPFVKENLRLQTHDINPDWCYCSAGFAKYPFEVIFDQELEVEMLESPLKGDERCRFKITLPTDRRILHKT